MENNDKIVQDLAMELSTAYLLIREAIPLALKALTYGTTASPLEQYEFWDAVRSIEDYIDLINYGKKDDFSESFDLRTGERCIDQRLVSMEKLYHSIGARSDGDLAQRVDDIAALGI